MVELISRQSVIELIQTKINACKEAEARGLVITQTPLEAKETILRTLLDQLSYIPTANPEPKPLEEVLKEKFALVRMTNTGALEYKAWSINGWYWTYNKTFAYRFVDQKALNNDGHHVDLEPGEKWIKVS